MLLETDEEEQAEKGWRKDTDTHPSSASYSRGGGVNILIFSWSSLPCWAFELGVRDCPRCGGGGETLSGSTCGEWGVG